jgi:hypothetical protein
MLTKILTLLVLSAAPQVATAAAPVVSAPVEQKFVTIRYPADYFDPKALKKLPENIKWKFELDKVTMQSAIPTTELRIMDASPDVDRDEVMAFLEWYATHVYEENDR